MLSVYMIGYKSTQGLPPATYPLDLVAGATGAFSLRRLRVAYAGSAIRVRRSTDNMEQDIGFSGDYLDTVSLLAFCGGGNGLIRTWYDQSGNTRDVGQSSAGSQPQIVSSGTLLVGFGGLPVIDFAGSVLASTVNTSSFITTTAGTVFTVFNADTAAGSSPPDGRSLWCHAAGNAGMTFQSGAGCCTYVFASSAFRTAVTTGLSAGQNYIGVWWHNSTTIKNYVNTDTAGASTSAGTSDALTSTLRLGQAGTGTGGTSFDGKMTEWISYASALSDPNIDTLGQAQASVYGITWI